MQPDRTGIDPATDRSTAILGTLMFVAGFVIVMCFVMGGRP